jgi:phage repressor protein C with HTH and peptisase S24 domain
MSIHKLIRDGRARLRLTEEEFAAGVGVTRGSVQQWEREGGTAPTRKNQPAVAAALGITVAELMGGNGDQGNGKSPLREIDLTDNADYPAIRHVRFKLSAGASGFAVEYEQDDGVPMVFGSAWYAKRCLTPGKLFAVAVSNGSMEPGLHSGDTVVVNTECADPKDGHVFAVNYEGELVIKRLIRDAGEWWLSSDNVDQRRYPRKVCGEGVFLIGEIVHKQSERI